MTRRNGNFRKKIAVSLFFHFSLIVLLFSLKSSFSNTKALAMQALFSMEFTLSKTAARPYPPFLTLMCKIFIAQGAI